MKPFVLGACGGELLPPSSGSTQARTTPGILFGARLSGREVTALEVAAL